MSKSINIKGHRKNSISNWLSVLILTILGTGGCCAIGYPLTHYLDKYDYPKEIPENKNIIKCSCIPSLIFIVICVCCFNKVKSINH